MSADTMAIKRLREAIMDAVQSGEWHHTGPNAIDDAISAIAASDDHRVVQLERLLVETDDTQRAAMAEQEAVALQQELDRLRAGVVLPASLWPSDDDADLVESAARNLDTAREFALAEGIFGEEEAEEDQEDCNLLRALATRLRNAARIARESSHATCEDCDGTGWAAETNPGTGGGTGRDEQIAVPCPRGCPDPEEPVPAFQRGDRVTVATEPALVGEVTFPPAHLHGGLGDLAKVWIKWPDGGASGHDPKDVTIIGARGCEADEQGPEDPAF